VTEAGEPGRAANAAARDGEAQQPADGGVSPRRPWSTWPADRVCWAVAALLGVGTVVLYAAVAGHEFIRFDDPRYVTENPVVQRGLSWDGIAWTFTAFHASNWHPLTWLSHMLDVELFGLNAGAHHVVNVLLHAVNAGLLFFVLARMTGALGRSAFVAALFAVHPLHVESVAWIAERKDVLSSLFGLLALAAYARYAEHPGRRRYAPVVLCFALSVLAKPMWVTLPVLLLLLDYWPLGRAPSGPPAEASSFERPRVPWARLVLEKVPLLVLAAGSSVVTMLAQFRGDSVTGLELGVGARLGNAAVSYLRYVEQTFWPSSLSIFYPHPRGGLPAGVGILSGVLLVVTTAALLRYARRLPWIAVGWCWFLGTLVPVIGIVQVGAQSRADRYTYLPVIGLFVAVAWGALALGRRWRATTAAAALAVAAIVVLSGMTIGQLRHWRTHETLFRHATEVSPENAHAHAILSKELRRLRRLEDSMLHARESVRLEPGDTRYWNNLALSARELGQVAEAREALERAVAIDPKEGPTWSNLGRLELDAGNLGAAEAAFREATRLAPGIPDLWFRLATVQVRAGRLLDAKLALERAVWLAPGDRELLWHLGSVQIATGRRDDARRTAAQLERIAPELARELRARAAAPPGP
jgi:Flp pilus assembly protein TadD